MIWRHAYHQPHRVEGRRRRNILKLFAASAAGLSLSNSAWAQSATFVDPLTSGGPSNAPGDAGQVSAVPQPFRIIDISDQQSKVLEIFEFGCPYCRALNDNLRSWGATLPPGWVFSQVPALVGPSYVTMSLAYLAEQEADPNGLPAFMSHCFALIQDNKLPIDDLKTYVEAANLTGTDLTRFRTALTNPANESSLLKIATINQQAQITATPSLIINGRYVITPNDTNGNYGLFFNLADGLISQSITNGTNDSPSTPGQQEPTGGPG